MFKLTLKKKIVVEKYYRTLENKKTNQIKFKR